MAESKLVDQYGRPFIKKELSKEIAAPSLTGVRSVWNNDSVASGITPDRLARLLMDAANNDANAYLTLAEEMEERDMHYASVLGTRKRAVSGLPVTVEAATDDKRDQDLADAVRALVRRPEFGEAVDDLLDGLGKGYSVVEMSWDTKRTPWEPRNRLEKINGDWQPVDGYIWRDPRFFMFDRNNGRHLRLLDEQNSFDGLPLPPHRFICHIPKLKSGLPIRGGLARLAAVAYMCKSYTLTDWMAFAEVFGMPLRVGKYGPGATETDIRTLINAIANIGTDAAAAIPDSMKIEFQEAGNKSGGQELFLKLAEWLDRQVSKGVLGQVASSEGTPGRLGNDDTQDEVRNDILIADAKQLSNTLNRDLVRPFIDLNFGPQEQYPRIILQVTEPDDMESLAKVLEIVVPMGIGIEASVARDRLGFPDPEPGAVLLQAPGVQPVPATDSAANHQQGCTCGHCATALNNQQPQYLDELEADGLADWEQQMEGIINPVRELADRADSYEAFIAGLPGLLDEMDNNELVRALAEQAFKARGLGDATDEVSGS